ncbi:MAG: hypothetical protein WCI43_08105, partial [Candidatus Firestonebacteria bacterium]
MLSLPNTEFTGYNKQIFGGDVEFKLGGLSIKAIGAQSKGKTDVVQFTGGYNRVIMDVYDTGFIRNKYYKLKDVSIDSGSVQIWIDDLNGTNNNYPPAYPPDRGVDPTLYTQKTTNKNTPGVSNYSLDYLHPGTDYTVDYQSGIVTFNKYILPNYVLVVAYTAKGGTLQVPNGYNGTNFDFEETTMRDPIIPPNLIDPNSRFLQPLVGDPNYFNMQLMNIYNLGNKKILLPQYDPEFVFKIYDSNSVEQPLASYEYSLDIDNGLVLITKGGNTKPFDSVSTPNAYPTFINPTTQTRYRMHVEYKYKINSYQLNHFGIVKGSEVISVNGVRFTRDVQYSIDYETGFIFFFNQEEILNKTVIITYEYSPFGGSGQSNLFGARAEYKLSALSLGSTYLFTGTQTPLDVPSVGSSPTSLNVFDIDSKLSITGDMIESVFGKTWLLPTEISMSGEIAKSFYDPNTYSAKNGEKGVGMIDSMEGTDNIAGLPTLYTSWFPSGLPSHDADLKNSFTDPANNNRAIVPLSNYDDYGHDSTVTAKRQMLKADYNFVDGIWEGFRYPVSTSGADYSRYKYLELWMLTDWTKDVSLNVDVGVLSEDSNNNLAMDTEDLNNDGILQNDEDTGFYERYNSSVIKVGARNNILDKEDMDNNGRLDTAEDYYSYTISVNSPNYVAKTVSTGQGTWKLLKIPLNFYNTSTTPVTYGKPSATLIKHVRFWLKSKTSASGSIVLESMQFTGNKWELKDANLTPVFNVKAISKDTDQSYLPLTDVFFTVQTSADANRESSLSLIYTNPSNATCYATTIFARPQSYMDYNKLNFDIYKKTTSPGDVVFIKIGSDEVNYFQYNISLDNISPGWQTVSVPLNSPNSKAGSFYMNNVQRVSVGVNSSGPGGEVWVNNFRVVDSIKTEGTAQRLSGTVKFGEVLSTTLDYRNMQSRFSLFENASANMNLSASQASQ